MLKSDKILILEPDELFDNFRECRTFKQRIQTFFNKIKLILKRILASILRKDEVKPLQGVMF